MIVTEWNAFLKDDLLTNGNLLAMTVGVFDGVHLGHQALLKRIISYNAGYTPAVVTFKSNHKKKGLGVGDQGSDYMDIQSFQERLETFKRMGIKITIVVDFNEEFKHMPGINFLEMLIKHGSLGFFAVGSNFRCGYQLDTDAKMIQAFFNSRSIPAEIVPEVMEDSLPISSSRIRAAIAAGNIDLADIMMGRE